jgi:hypothetical protein
MRLLLGLLILAGCGHTQSFTPQPECRTAHRHIRGAHAVRLHAPPPVEVDPFPGAH